MARVVNVLRVPPPSGGKIGPLQVILAGLVLDIQPGGVEGTMDTDGRTAWRRYQGYCRIPPLPDVRMQDRLIDPGDIDAYTQLPAEYIVRGLQRWPGHHLELLLDRREGA